MPLGNIILRFFLSCVVTYPFSFNCTCVQTSILTILQMWNLKYIFSKGNDDWTELCRNTKYIKKSIKNVMIFLFIKFTHTFVIVKL